uniref:tRNA wybutosine-synthesizing protein 4 n=1 Tax=Amphiprion percula TaxID=161767 RepID=A0A3P8U2N0_AMPPE
MPTTNRTKKKQGKDTAVQGTNDSSVVSKVSAAAQGYFKDDFLQHFVCKVTRRAPLINRGYYVRWRAVDHCVKRFLQVTATCTNRQILSLGAGFDSLYFRLHADGALDNVVVFEVDFLTSRDGKPGCWTPMNLIFSRYRLLGVDVREENQVEEALCTAGLDWAAPTLILSEVVLTYMETQRSDAVISWAAKLLPQSLFVMYEQIHPHDAFGRIMQEHFLKLNSTLHALQQYPDTSAQRQRFLDKASTVCLDMNDFYLGLVLRRNEVVLESLEPFDEYEVSCCILHKIRLLLNIQNLTRPGHLLLTGGSSRGGRGATSRVLLRGQEGWRSVSVEASADLDSTTRLLLYLEEASLVLGGRSSPLSPTRGLYRVTVAPLEGGDAVKVNVQQLVCTGDPPPPRWRHTVTVVRHKSRNFLCVFGGKNESEAALGDIFFLDVDQQHWTEIPVEGAAPEPRHSHSACSHNGGLVMFGGLSRCGAPLGDTVLLRPTERGFIWERKNVQPPPVPRFSHSAHVCGQKLVVVGGVWLHSDGVPGVLVITMETCSSVEFSLNTSSVPWPLMLQSFCSELTDPEELILVGGGGNCFSFGTHLNPQIVSLDLRPALG